MSRHVSSLGLVVLWSLAALVGCQPQQPFYFHERGEMAHYRGMATEIEYPDSRVETLPDVEGATPPMTLSTEGATEVWDLSLEEAMRHALTNARVMKVLGASAIAIANTNGPGMPEFITRTPQAVPTIYEPAISEADPRFGTEAALSAFDAQFSTALNWGKLDTPQNVASQFAPDQPGSAFRSVNVADTSTFQARLQKTNVTGATVALNHNVQYLNSNSGTRQFPSDYNVNVEAEIRQPLLRGAGVEFNRIAGPNATPGQFTGVVLARLNTDIALATFEIGIRNLVNDVEVAYWELYFTYRNLDAVIAGRNSALQTWRKVYALYQLGAKGGEADREAQAREQYFLFRSSVERALNSLYKAEANLRYVMGIASTDGRLIRTSEEPTIAKVQFDWYAIHNEAICRSVELRQQRWTVKRREMELIAAKNFLLPRLDAVARYRWLGLGDDLIARDTTTTNDRAFAYNNMLTGKYQEWTAGVELAVPLGFRREMAGVRYSQLQLTRERSVLQEQELEVSHQLAYSIRDLDANHVLSQTNFNRRVAAQRQVEAVQAAYDTGTVTIDVLLNAQRLLAQAESDFFRSVVDYNKSIAQVHYRKGSLLEYDGVYLAEGPWPAKAYFDACRLARARDAGHYIDYGVTLPQVTSRGAYLQFGGDSTTIGTPANQGKGQDGKGDGKPAEVIPAPTPAPAPLPPVSPTKTTSAASAPANSSAGGPQLVAPQAVPATRPAPQTAGQWSAVRRTSYQQGSATKPDAVDSAAGPVAAAPSGGWKRVQ